MQTVQTKKPGMDILFLGKIDLKIRNITRYTEAHFLRMNSLITALNKS